MRGGNYLPYEREPEPVALGGVGVVTLIELVEYPADIGFGNGETVVPDREGHAAGELLQTDPYLTVLRGELHGIVDEIEPYMAQKIFIACVFYLVKVNVELDLFLFPLALEREYGRAPAHQAGMCWP